MDASSAVLLEYQRRCLRHGFVLCTLALLSALLIPFYAAPRTGLAAHVVGITGGLLLMGAALAFPRMSLPRRLASATYWMLVVSLYLGFIGQWLGGLLGLTRVFLVTAAGAPAGPVFWETAVEIVTKGITPTTILPCVFVVYGLRRSAAV